MDLNNKTALELGKMIKDKKLSSVELTKHILNNIKNRENDINAYTLIIEDEAVKQAEQIQSKIDAGEVLSEIAGVPMAVKDNICIKDYVTSCSSKMLENFKPPYNASVIEKLKSAGAIILGKLNMDEFAMGSSTETSFFGPTKNPWNLEYVPGGSSGGSAAAVAANEAIYTIGSDTGGSIRQPCSFCGVSGIKPTYGTVSRYGLIAFASSLDQIGPIGKDIKDCAKVLSIMSGHDSKDSTSIKNLNLDFSQCFDENIKNLKIGFPKNYFGNGLNEEIKNSIYESLKIFERLGAIIEEFDMPEIDYAIDAYYIIACAEASSNLSRYDGIKYGYRSKNAENISDVFYNSRSEGFGIEVKRRIMLGSFVLSSGYYDAYYKKGLKVRTIINKSFKKAFDKYDLIISPVAPTTAFKIGENISDPLKMYLGDIYTVAVNLAGIPAVSIPCGFDKNGLPIGFQLIGKEFSEPILIRAAYSFQKNTDFHTKKPII